MELQLGSSLGLSPVTQLNVPNNHLGQQKCQNHAPLPQPLVAAFFPLPEWENNTLLGFAHKKTQLLDLHDCGSPWGKVQGHGKSGFGDRMFECVQAVKDSSYG